MSSLRTTTCDTSIVPSDITAWDIGQTSGIRMKNIRNKNASLCFGRALLNREPWFL